MRNTSKMMTLENKFPLLTMKYDCTISKGADITVAFEVELLELYTVTGAEYEAVHGCWCKVIKVLPGYSIMHKQDRFIKRKYKPELQKDDIDFLNRSFEHHFNGRPYLKHTCYLCLMKATKECNRMQSSFSTLCRGHIILKEVNRETAAKLMEAVEQSARVMDDSGFVKLHRLADDEIVMMGEKAGLIECYFSFMSEDGATLQDIELLAREMRIDDNRLCLYILSDAEGLPGTVATDIRHERLFADRPDCHLSFASPVGLLLFCNHIYGQYVIIDNSEESLQKFGKLARNMRSLSHYSRSNSINREWIDHYLNEVHSYGLTLIRAHSNVMAWSDDAEKLKHVKNDMGSQLASIEYVPCHNTIDYPTPYQAVIPGNATDFPVEGSFHIFIGWAVCLFTEGTNYRSSLSPFGIKMVDRLTGEPLHLDISDLLTKRGITANRNRSMLGPSGSSKSLFMNHLTHQYWGQGTRVVLVDTGDSHQGLRKMIRRKMNGTDGVYFTYTEEKPISFNPFYIDDYAFDMEKKDSIKTLLLTLWRSEDDKVTKTESGMLGSAVSACIKRTKADQSIVPLFNTLYEYMWDNYRKELVERDVKVKKPDFNVGNMLTTMWQHHRGGCYGFLLSSAENTDLLDKRFIVFEIDSIKDNRELFPIVAIIIMEVLINRVRRLRRVRKQLVCEEIWKALSSVNMVEYLRYMYKTVRKYFSEAIMVTQEVDDIISSPIVRESIISNPDYKILLDQGKYINKFDSIQSLLGLTEKEKSQILSISMVNNPSGFCKEVWIKLSGTQSAVYATGVSVGEYLACTIKEIKKMEVYRLAEQLDGDIEAAIRQPAKRRRNKE